jgi:hypothetical protein
MAPAASVLSAPFIMQYSQHCSIAALLGSCSVYLHMLLVADSSMEPGMISTDRCGQGKAG